MILLNMFEIRRQRIQNSTGFSFQESLSLLHDPSITTMKNHLLSFILVLTWIIPINARNEMFVHLSVRNDISQNLGLILNSEEIKHGDHIIQKHACVVERLKMLDGKPAKNYSTRIGAFRMPGCIKIKF